MSPILYKILAGTILFIFAFMLLMVKGNKNIQFIEFVLYIFPFISITLLPSIGYPTIFDLITLTFLLFFYRPRTGLGISMKTYTYLLFIFFLSLLFGGINADTISYDSIPDLVQLICIFCFLKIMFDEIVLNPFFFNQIIKLINLAMVVSIVFLCCQFIFGTQFSFDKTPNVNVLQGDKIRFPSYFQDPQKYAQFLSAGFFISLIQTNTRKSTNWTFYLLPVSILSALLFTGGRAGLMGLILGISLIALFGSTRYKLAILIAILSIMLISLLYADQISIFNRESTFSDAYEFRFEVWKDAFEIFKAHPYVGIGIGNYAAYVSIHNPDQYWVASNVYTAFDHPESGYLKLLVEFGLVGFLALFSLIILPIIQGIKYYIKSKDYVTLLLIAAILSWFVGFTTVYSLSDSRIALIVAIIVILLIARYKIHLVNESI